MARAPRVCGDDPTVDVPSLSAFHVLPAYAGMIPTLCILAPPSPKCSPRMRG